MSGSCHGRGGPLRSVRHTETFVLTRIQTGAQPLLDGHGKVQGGFQTLYEREEPHPPGVPLSTHVDPTKVNENIPSEAEVEAAVQCLRLHRAGRHTHLVEK